MFVGITADIIVLAIDIIGLEHRHNGPYQYFNYLERRYYSGTTIERRVKHGVVSHVEHGGDTRSRTGHGAPHHGESLGDQPGRGLGYRRTIQFGVR